MKILLVTGIEGAQNCADVMAKQLGIEVRIAEGRRAALAALRAEEFSVVVVDESIASCDPAAADAIWQRAGLAVPLELNFALVGVARVVREVRAGLNRRNREQELAQRAASAAIGAELKGTLAGLLLHSELALRENHVPAAVADKLKVVAHLATNLRDRLNPLRPSRRPPSVS